MSRPIVPPAGKATHYLESPRASPATSCMHFYPTVFKVTPSGTFTTLVAFAPSNGVPSGGPLLQGSDGNFYGTTRNVGANGDGTVFKMTPSGMLTTLISFDFSTGEYPSAGLIEGNDGNFYGTTAGDSDETVDSIFPDAGTMFKITPSGMLTTLVAFDLTKGVNPLAPVARVSPEIDEHGFGPGRLGRGCSNAAQKAETDEINKPAQWQQRFHAGPLCIALVPNTTLFRAHFPLRRRSSRGNEAPIFSARTTCVCHRFSD